MERYCSIRRQNENDTNLAAWEVPFCRKISDFRVRCPRTRAVLRVQGCQIEHQLLNISWNILSLIYSLLAHNFGEFICKSCCRDHRSRNRKIVKDGVANHPQLSGGSKKCSFFQFCRCLRDQKLKSAGLVCCWKFTKLVSLEHPLCSDWTDNLNKSTVAP